MPINANPASLLTGGLEKKEKFIWLLIFDFTFLELVEFLCPSVATGLSSCLYVQGCILSRGCVLHDQLIMRVLKNNIEQNIDLAASFSICN